MALNGSELLDAPWQTIYSPFTDLFERVLGNGNTFYLFPLTILAFGLFIKTKNPIVVTMFMIASGAFFSAGHIFIGATEIAMAYTIFTALGIAGLVMTLIFQRR